MEKFVNDIAPSAAVRKPKVVLLEDEKLLQEFFKYWICSTLPNVDLAVFANGDEAWQELCRAPVDLFITDELHRGMCGSEIIKRLAETGGSCAVLWTSGGSQPMPDGTLIGKGIWVWCLGKPFTKAQFTAKIQFLCCGPGGLFPGAFPVPPDDGRVYKNN
jgi:DNA-binding response OmpR family regulator